MRPTYINKILLAGLTLMSLSGCIKDIKDNQIRQDDFSNSSTVLFINANVTSTRNSISVDGTPVNFNTIAYGGQFPNSPSPGFLVQPGIRNIVIRDTMGSTTQVPLSFAQNLQVGKNYTVFLYDTITSPQQRTIQTDIEIPNDTTARVRFANFIFSRSAVPAVDIFSVKRNSNVFTNVQVTEVSNFIPYASSLNDTLIVRETGTATTLTQLNGFNPTRKRSYTLVFRGRYQSTSGTVARTLASYINF